VTENLDESMDINSAWGSIRENIKTLVEEDIEYHRLKFNKPWYDDECSKLINQWKRLNYNGCKIQTKSMEIICKF
jgi:hypothetical protein